MVHTYFLNEPVPYQPTRQYTEFVDFEIDEDEDEEENELTPKVKYSNILQEEEYEEEDTDFFPIK
jgi:hypothetical protein